MAQWKLAIGTSEPCLFKKSLTLLAPSPTALLLTLESIINDRSELAQQYYPH